MVDLQSLSHVLIMEKEFEELQKIENDFYAKVGQYITEMETRKSGCTDYASESIINDEIKSVRTVVEAIHNRRMMKIMEIAFITASGTTIALDRMIESERAMFDEIVVAVNREKLNLKTAHVNR